jgi:hypothetical protein
MFPVTPQKDRQFPPHRSSVVGMVGRRLRWDGQPVRRIVMLAAVMSSFAAMSAANAAEQRVYGVVGSEVQIRIDAVSGAVEPAANVPVDVTRTTTPSGTITTIVPRA